MYGIDDALLIGGLAASLAGTGMGIAANEQAQGAMNSTRAQEVKRQNQLQDQANSVFQKRLSTSGADTAQKETNAGAAQRQSVYQALKQVASPVAGALPANGSTTGNTIVDSNGDPTQTANTLGSTRASAWSKLASEAAAKQGGYQDYQTQQNLDTADTNRRLGVVENRARGWASLFPTEMEVASHRGDALAGWGQLASALGSVASMGGAVALGATPIATGTAGSVGGTMTNLGPAVSGSVEAAANPFDYSNLNQWLPAASYNPWASVGSN